MFEANKPAINNLLSDEDRRNRELSESLLNVSTERIMAERRMINEFFEN